MNKLEIIEALEAAEIDFDAKANKADLETIYNDAVADGTIEPADETNETTASGKPYYAVKDIRLHGAHYAPGEAIEEVSDDDVKRLGPLLSKTKPAD